MKTTVVLRDDLYHILVQKFGKRNISSTINEILFKVLMKKEKDLFGVDKGLGLKPFVRDHHDRF